MIPKLFASGNSLTEISEKIGQLSMLTVLDLSHNNISAMPASLVECQRLQRLILSYNSLTSLPEKIGNLNDLRLLKVDNNQLAALPEDIGNLYYLDDVDFSKNQLAELPRTLNGWRVKRMFLQKNALVDLPKEIGWLQSLEVLDLSGNRIRILPGEVGELRKLESLSLTGNRLEQLPVLEECLALKELYLGDNRIGKFPEEFFDRIPGIKVLDLHGNQLQNVPEAITKAPNLERLNLADNDLFSILPELALIGTLKSLNIDGNPIRTIRKDILKRGTGDLLKYLRSRIANIEEIDRENEKDTFFHSIGSPRPHDAIRTKTLDLSGRDLEGVPESFLEALTGRDIQMVDLSNNRLSIFPEKLLGIADTVSSLNVAKNRFGSLDSGFLSKFRYLGSLDVSANDLEDLPLGLGECLDLRELVIASNRLRRLPDSVYTIKKLEVLIANSNKIVNIEVERLAKLEALTVLDLSNNEIDNVPPTLGRLGLRYNRSVKLEGNRFKVPNAQTLAKGTQEVLKYLRSRLPDSLPE